MKSTGVGIFPETRKRDHERKKRGLKETAKGRDGNRTQMT